MQSSVLLFQPPERHLLLSLHSFSLQTAEFIKHGTRQQMKKSGGPLWGFSEDTSNPGLPLYYVNGFSTGKTKATGSSSLLQPHQRK